MNSFKRSSATIPLVSLGVVCLFTGSGLANIAESSTSAQETNSETVYVHESSNEWWQQIVVPSDTRRVAIDNGYNQWLLTGTWWGHFIGNNHINSGEMVRIIVSNGQTPWISEWFRYLIEQPVDAGNGYQYHLIVHQSSNEWWQQVVPLVPVNWIEIRQGNEQWRMKLEDYGHFTSNHHIERGSKIEFIFETDGPEGSPVVERSWFNYLFDQPAIRQECAVDDDACPWDYACQEQFYGGGFCVPHPSEGEVCGSHTTGPITCKFSLNCIPGPVHTSYCHSRCRNHGDCHQGRFCFDDICSEPICDVAIAKTENGYGFHASYIDAIWQNFGGLKLNSLQGKVYREQLSGPCTTATPHCDSLPQEPLCVTDEFGQQQEFDGPCAALKTMISNVNLPDPLVRGNTYAPEWSVPSWQATPGTCN